MYLDRDNPVFDEALEVLCMLNTWPSISFLSDLCTDLGFRRQQQVEELLQELTRRGFAVRSSTGQVDPDNGRTGRAAWIDSSGAAQAKLSAAQYFQKLYAACESRTPVAERDA